MKSGCRVFSFKVVTICGNGKLVYKKLKNLSNIKLSKKKPNEDLVWMAHQVWNKTKTDFLSCNIQKFQIDMSISFWLTA